MNDEKAQPREEQSFRLTGEVDGSRLTYDLTALFEARVRLAEGDAAAASQLAEGSLRKLGTQCQIESEACAWVPLAEWVLGEALRSIDGREVEAEAVLARAAEHAPNTWIATSITR